VKIRVAFLMTLIISIAVLSACQKAEPAQTADSDVADVPASPKGGDLRGDDAAPNPGLDNVSRLTLGMFKLEGSTNAVTPEQAAKLLPLWKLIQGGTLKSDAETNAVVKQIEGQMTEAQRAAIDALSLTMEDMTAWMQEQGIEMTAPEGAPGNMPNMSEGERMEMRERFQNMTEEERAAAMEEGGFQRPEGAPEGQGGPQGQAPGDGQPLVGNRQGIGGMRGGNNAMLEPLIALLTERAAQ